MDKVWRIGLTGGVGSGKSTAAKVLAQMGAAVLDADAIARSLTAVGGLAIAPLRAHFGDSVIDAQGALDRPQMRALAFTNPSAKEHLEAIVHPLVQQAMDQQAQAALDDGARVLIFDIPLLVESGRWRSQVDGVLVIDCSIETQITRVQARNAWPRDQIMAVIQSQASRAQRLAVADWVILNEDMDISTFENKVMLLGLQWGLPTDPLALNRSPSPSGR
ncbi:MAG: dephospho-CoA kinase [Betaproteobacteria bacterium]|nr:dephospho-CoA kinase [Betaproteobacteria bacterium]NBY04492.1 dephospho-CoA kinase [Betaproteobacteria bacterium]